VTVHQLNTVTGLSRDRVIRFTATVQCAVSVPEGRRYDVRCIMMCCISQSGTAGTDPANWFDSLG